MDIKIGEKVVFGSRNGERTRGVVVGRTRGGKWKVRQDEARGRHPVGAVWTVPEGLVQADDGSPGSIPDGGRPPAASAGFAIGDRVSFDAGRKGRIEGTVVRINRTTVALADTTDGRPVGWRVAPATLVKIGTAPLPAVAPAVTSVCRIGDRVRVEALFGPNRKDIGGPGFDVHTVTWVGREAGRGNVVELDGGRRAAESCILGIDDGPPRPSAEILRDIRNAYSRLSPENLSCDGERSRGAQADAAARINRWLRLLFREAGRVVAEDEAMRTESV